MLRRIKSKLFVGKKPFEIPTVSYFGCADELIAPLVSGWVSYTDSGGNPVTLKITKGKEVQLVIANIERNDVFLSGQVESPFCGFSAQFSSDNFYKAEIEVLGAIGNLTKPAPNYKDRKVFFIHIPKAAGSSVNDLVSSAISDSYYTHIEGMRDQWDEIKNAKFLSGHIRYSEYQQVFSKHDYVVFAFFREPYSHLKSHLNWVRRLAEPELIKSRKSHSDIVHKIADNLAKLDFTSSDNLSSYAKSLKPIAYGLFDNCQVRFLANVKPNELVGQEHLDQAIKNLRHLHFVGISEYSKESQTQLLALLGLDMKKTEAKSNVNSYDYGLDITDENILLALKPLVQFDLQLYKEAKKIFLNQTESISGTDHA